MSLRSELETATTKEARTEDQGETWSQQCPRARHVQLWRPEGAPVAAGVRTWYADWREAGGIRSWQEDLVVGAVRLTWLAHISRVNRPLAKSKGISDHSTFDVLTPGSIKLQVIAKNKRTT